MSNTIENALSRLDFYYIKKNHQYSKWGETFKQNDIRARLYALAISPICAGGFILKTGVDIGKLASMGVRSICNRRLETGNIQLGAVYVAEQVRNLAGTLFGSIIGVMNPELAKNAFLVNSDVLLPRCLDKKTAAQLLALTNRVLTFFDDHDIDYRVTSGTFLGVFRHHGIIPWDDDVDLFLHPDATAKLQELVGDGTFEAETGLAIHWDDNTGGWRAFFPDGDDAASILKGAKFPFIDLFTTTMTEDGRIVYRSNMMRKWAPQEYYTFAEWNNAKDYEFGPFAVKGPEQWKDYFHRAFGETAMDFAYLLYHHNDFSIKRWPQRVVVDTKTPVEYDHDLYEQLKHGPEQVPEAVAGE